MREPYMCIQGIVKLAELSPSERELEIDIRIRMQPACLFLCVCVCVYKGSYLQSICLYVRFILRN